MKNIGLFGGTFNPPHLAHKRLANEMKEKANLDEIIVMPTFVPPHKNANDLAECEDRLNMCRLTFFEEYFSVSDLEIKRKGKSYTYDTLCELKKLFCNDKIFLIIGSDMLLSFHKWYNYKEILSLCTLCVISREDEKSAKQLDEYARKTLGLKSEEGEIIISNTKPFELSSTLIRERIKSGKDASGFVEENTLQYIKERGLYI